MENAEEVVANWEDIKSKEEGAKMATVFPVFQRGCRHCFKLMNCKSARKAGFEWEEIGPVIEKIKEELRMAG